MLKKILGSETNFILFLTFLITVSGLSSLFYNQFRVAPPNTVYTFAHNYVPDYYQYLSWMKDGADGKILITSRYSPDNFTRKPAYLFYPLLGWISGKLGLPLFLGYTIARIFLSLFKLGIIFWLISQIFSRSAERKLAFFLALFLPPFYKLFPFQMLRRDITSLDILQRTFFLPHNLATTIFILAGSICINIYIGASNKKARVSKFLILASIFFFLASVTNPAMLAIFYLFLGVALLITFLQKPSRKLITGSLVAFSPGFLAIIFYQHLFSHFLPFSWLFNQQKNVILMTNLKDYFLNCGPVIFFFPFAVLPFLKIKKFLANFVLSWGIIPFLIFPLLGKVLPFSQERFFEISHFIPLAILASAGFYSLTNLIKKEKMKIVTQRGLVAVLVIFVLPYLWFSLRSQIDLFAKPYYFNIFIPKSTLEAFSWLDKNTPDESVVAAGFYTSNMLPTFSHNKVVFGHEFVTYKAPERKADTETILGQDTPPPQILELLRKNQIRYLLVNLERPLSSTNLSALPNLKLVYNHEENKIFRFEESKIR